MGIFDLPPEDKRKVSKSVFHILNFENGKNSKHIKEPDHYIRYRLGHDLRYGTVFIAVVTFILSYLHTYYGFAPSLAGYPVQTISEYTINEKMLGFYLHYINYSGLVLIPWALFYFVWFKINVDFSKYNLMRNIEPSHFNPKPCHGYRDFGKRLKWIILLMLVLLLFSPYVMFQPSKISAIFFVDIMGAIRVFFEYPVFVFIVSMVIAFWYTVFAQMFLHAFFLFSYFYYEFKHPPKGDN